MITVDFMVAFKVSMRIMGMITTLRSIVAYLRPDLDAHAVPVDSDTNATVGPHRMV